MPTQGELRDESIAADRNSGMLLTNIANKYDLCRARISQILREQRLLNKIKQLQELLSNG